MFEQDYLMRLLMQFMEAMRRSIERADDGRDPAAAADMLENAIGDATDLDGSMLLSLAPESMASVLQVSGVDPHVTEYVANSLQLESEFLRSAGNDELAEVRAGQARALASTFGFELAEARRLSGSTISRRLRTECKPLPSASSRIACFGKNGSNSRDFGTVSQRDSV